MKVTGRTILDYETEIDLSHVDQVVFHLSKHHQIVVSLYSARTPGREGVEITSDYRRIIVRPCAANSIEVDVER